MRGLHEADEPDYMPREKQRSGGRFAPVVYVGAEAPTPWKIALRRFFMSAVRARVPGGWRTLRRASLIEGGRKASPRDGGVSYMERKARTRAATDR